jgi:N-acetylmuramoyl-L-alanine amidase
MTVYSVSGGRLLADGSPVSWRPSPNVGGVCRPRFLVLHFTGGGEAGAIETLTTPGGVSAHFVVGEGGTITQLVDLDRTAWHAGKSSWRDVTASLNPVSIGVEIANYGDAVEGSPGAYRAFGRPIPDDRVMVARHVNGGPARPWHTYPEAQIEAVIAIGRALHASFHFDDVVGHDQIAPTRKVDPGPAFPFMRVRAAILGAAGGDVGVPPIAADLPDHSVMQLQRALNRLGYGPLDVDGSPGPKTRDATRRFQASAGLDVDGVAGPMTWAALDAAMAAKG